MPIDFSNPGRTIQAGVILMGLTEILDVAPIDFLNSLSKKFTAMMPITDELKAKAYDIEFHWITEKGTPAELTAGISLNATVRMYEHGKCGMDWLMVDRILTKLARRWTLYL